MFQFSIGYLVTLYFISNSLPQTLCFILYWEAVANDICSNQLSGTDCTKAVERSAREQNVKTYS